MSPSRDPVGTINVVDPSPLNWLYITYNTVEELVRVNHDGVVEPAAMSGYHWADDRTLDVKVREGERFPDGQPLDAAAVKAQLRRAEQVGGPAPAGHALQPRPAHDARGHGRACGALPPART